MNSLQMEEPMREKRNHRISSIFAILVALLTYPLFCNPSIAKQFTVKVPVNVRNVPDIFPRVAVNLFVKDKNGAGVSLVKHVQLINGSYNGTVVFEFDVPETMDPRVMTSYDAKLLLVHETASGDFDWNKMKRPSQWAAQFSAVTIDPTQPLNETDSGQINPRKFLIRR